MSSFNVPSQERFIGAVLDALVCGETERGRDEETHASFKEIEATYLRSRL